MPLYTRIMAEPHHLPIARQDLSARKTNDLWFHPRAGSATPVSSRTCEPHLPRLQTTFALDAVAFFLVANPFAKVVFKRWEQVEGDVRGLEFLRVGVGDVVDQRAVG